MTKTRIYQIILTGVLSICSTLAYSQAFNPYQHAYQGWNGEKIKKASPIRTLLNKFSVNSSLGYGRTFYSHKVNSDVLETENKLIMLGEYTIANNNVDYTGVTDWLNAPTITTGTASLDSGSNNYILYSDSSEIKYGGSGYNIPINLSVHLDIDRFRIGGGIMYEMHRINQLNPKEQGVHPYVPNFKNTFMFRYYFTAGAKVYHVKGWDYNVDFQIGKVKYGNQYDKTALQNGIYFNVGIPFEYELSEYFWLVVRPSFDFKSYNMTISGTNNESTSFQHNQPAFYLNFGVRMKLPEIRRCPVKSCKTQLKHVHGSKEFRGQPFFKEQNPKIGELYPELEQYKRKKKSKHKGKY